VVATQVVEAGVDLGFLVAYWAIGPLDRIVQTAARCSHQGCLQNRKVVIFEPAEGSSPQGLYNTGLEVAAPALYPRPFTTRQSAANTFSLCPATSS